MFSITLNKAGIVCSNSKVFAGTDSIVELAKTSDIPEQYVHPQEKQCNYEPDLSNYATKDEVSGMSLIASGRWTVSDNNIIIDGLENISHMILFLSGDDWMEGDSNARLQLLSPSETVLTANKHKVLDKSSGGTNWFSYSDGEVDCIRLQSTTTSTYDAYAIYHLYNLDSDSFVSIPFSMFRDPYHDEWTLPYVLRFTNKIASIKYTRSSNKPHGTMYYWLYKA